MYYLISCICAIISYDLARSVTTFNSKFEFFNVNKLPLNVEYVICHGNIIILFLVLISGIILKRFTTINIYIYNPSFYWKNKKAILFLIFLIMAANFYHIQSSYIYVFLSR